MRKEKFQEKNDNPFNNAEYDYIKHLEKRISRIESHDKNDNTRLENIETFLDGSTKWRIGKFVKKDREFLDDGVI